MNSRPDTDRLVVPLPDLPAPPVTLGALRGVRAAGVAAGIKTSGAPDVGLLVFDERANVAAVFTQNKLAAAPVFVSREHLAASKGRLRAVVVSSGNANACTGERGVADAREMASRVAAALRCEPYEVLVASTGIIGRHLPMDKVRRGIDAALENLSADPGGAEAFLRAIMTTDAFRKEAGEELTCPEGKVRVAGVCKGAGMIHPNMATMLAFVGTDACLRREELSSVLRAVLPTSFNAVHVDTHASTNDSFFLFSTGRGPRVEEPAAREVERAIERTARRLAWLVARDGEGATKVTTISVRGALSHDAARAIAERVAASTLVRTALFGCDPNWGRFVSAVGNAPEVRGVERLRCVLQGITVFAEGAPVAFDADAASAAMKREDVSLVFELGDGPGHALLMTSDLGYRYVEINADYTT